MYKSQAMLKFAYRRTDRQAYRLIGRSYGVRMHGLTQALTQTQTYTHTHACSHARTRTERQRERERKEWETDVYKSGLQHVWTDCIISCFLKDMIITAVKMYNITSNYFTDLKMYNCTCWTICSQSILKSSAETHDEIKSWICLTGYGNRKEPFLHKLSMNLHFRLWLDSVYLIVLFNILV